MLQAISHLLTSLCLILYAFIPNPKYKNPKLLKNKTVIITGANSGLGKEAAKQFYKRGARVLMACRNLDKAKKAAEEIKLEVGAKYNGGILVIIYLDLSSFADIKKCAKEILKTEEKIDILINNAGIIEGPNSSTKDGIGHIFGVNHLGPFLLTLLLLPRIIRTGSARIISISSIGHKWADKLDFDDIECRKLPKVIMPETVFYGRTKKANIFFMKELGKRLKEVNADVTTYSLHPGVSFTEIFDTYLLSALPSILFPNWLKKLFKYLMHSPESCIQTTLYCAIDDKTAEESGHFYNRCSIASKYLQPVDNGDSKKLWSVSLKMCGIENDDRFFVKG